MSERGDGSCGRNRLVPTITRRKQSAGLPVWFIAWHTLKPAAVRMRTTYFKKYFCAMFESVQPGRAMTTLKRGFCALPSTAPIVCLPLPFGGAASVIGRVGRPPPQPESGADLRRLCPACRAPTGKWFHLFYYEDVSCSPNRSHAAPPGSHSAHAAHPGASASSADAGGELREFAGHKTFARNRKIKL